VQELVKQLDFPFLAGQREGRDLGDRCSRRRKYLSGRPADRRSGPGLPLHADRQSAYLIPTVVRIEEEKLAANVARLRADGVDLVVLLSHNGFDVDRKLAGPRQGHRRDPDRPHAPMPCRAGEGGDTLLIAAGSHGKFLARLDLEVRDSVFANYASG